MTESRLKRSLNEKRDCFFHSKLEFKDGPTGEKLLIVLNNNPDNQSPYLCCKTTSKVKYNLINEGCYSDKNIYIIEKKPFSKKTWIQFGPNSVFELEASELLQCHFNQEIKIIGELDTNSINAIINCYKRSDDISEYYLELLKK